MKNDYKIITFIYNGDSDIIATCKEMPSISGVGETKEEAIKEFKIVMTEVEEIMEEQGTPMPTKINK